MTRRRRPASGPAPVVDPVLVPSLVWQISGDLIVALDDALGDPTDAYVNGSQVWLCDDDQLGITLEWRLHPVSGFERPAGVETAELFSRMAAALQVGSPVVAPPGTLWDGVECFPAFGDPLSLDALRSRGRAVLGWEPTAAGLVDHEPIAQRWERSGRRTSIVDDVLAAMGFEDLASGHGGSSTA